MQNISKICFKTLESKKSKALALGYRNTRFFSSLLVDGQYTVEKTILNSEKETVDIVWSDGKISNFLPLWLIDHNPKTIHPTSLQRQQDSASLDFNVGLPKKAQILDGNKIMFSFELEGDICFDVEWLRKNDFTLKETDVFHKKKRLWKGKDMSKEDFFQISATEIMNNDSNFKKALEALIQDGVCFINNMPQTIEGTEKIVRKFGPPRETFYGGMWDTAPKDPSMVNDTAFTKDGLHAHTDCCYLEDSGGLQLFNCVAQSESTSKDKLNLEGEIEGATKLVDGFKVCEDLKENEPETYAFFCENPLEWFSIENGVYVKAYKPVIEFEHNDKIKKYQKQFRYNSYDLAPISYFNSLDKTREYYRHTKILNYYLRSNDYISFNKLNVGEMVIIDNHRVCHGRTAFTGYRNMIGCYIGVDDWQSAYRHLILNNK